MTILSDISAVSPSKLANELGSQISIPAIATTSFSSATQLTAELTNALGGLGLASMFNSAFASDQLISHGSKTSDFKATLRSKQSGAMVWFHVSPSIDESRTATYDHQTPVHHPGTIQVYKGTESRTFNVSGKFIARNTQEATDNLRFLNLIRGWTMPYFGKGTANSMDSNKLGAPPDIIDFNVYGDQNIKDIPCVLLSYHWVYPDNVDYIPTNDGVPFPTIMDVSISLIESYSPEQYSNFDITKYRRGDMVGAYTFSSIPVMELASDALTIDDGSIKQYTEDNPYNIA